MDKKITEDLSAVDLQDYYHAMKKRDKGKLLHYLMVRREAGDVKG